MADEAWAGAVNRFEFRVGDFTGSMASNLHSGFLRVADDPTRGVGANVPSDKINALQPRILPSLEAAAEGLDLGEHSRCPARGDYRESDWRLYLLIPLDFTSQFEFVQRLQSLPANIFPASLSPLSVHRSQFEATLANSPPPG